VGPLIAPFFLSGRYNKEEIIATKATCQASLHIIKLIAFSTIGFEVLEQVPLLLPMAAAVIAGTFVGKWLLRFLSEKSFLILYKTILTILSIQLLVDGLT